MELIADKVSKQTQFKMHWNMVQGCSGSVKGSGKLNLDPNLYQSIPNHAYGVKESFSTLKKYLGAIFMAEKGGDF